MDVQCRRQRNSWAASNYFVNRNRTLLTAECCCNCEAFSLYSLEHSEQAFCAAFNVGNLLGLQAD